MKKYDIKNTKSLLTQMPRTAKKIKVERVELEVKPAELEVKPAELEVKPAEFIVIYEKSSITSIHRSDVYLYFESFLKKLTNCNEESFNSVVSSHSVPIGFTDYDYGDDFDPASFQNIRVCRISHKKNTTVKILALTDFIIVIYIDSTCEGVKIDLGKGICCFSVQDFSKDGVAFV